jgi:hypothetical protein
MTGGERQLAPAGLVKSAGGRGGGKGASSSLVLGHGMGQAYSLVGAPRPTDMRGLLVLLLCRSTAW